MSSMSAQREFDAIVIGSGMGGLAFASIMAKLREWRVLVLERHFKIGGFTHTFIRPGGWSWDVGLHYVGEMGEGMMGRRLFDFITDGGVKWNPMPDVYDVFAYPTLQVRACKGEGNFRRALIDAFPGERDCIEQYFRDLKSAVAWTHRHFMAMAAPAPLSWMVRLVNRLTADLPLRVTQQYLERRFRDERLRAVATSQWGDYGLPPGQSAFATHAVIATHYLDGAWYPDGGAGEIAKATGAIIRAAGGELLVNHEVTCILLEGNRAVGVEVNVKKGKEGTRAEFRAPVIVSDAGAWNTFTRLLPSSSLPFRNELMSPPVGFEVVELFLGLRRDPREMGFQGENHWIFTSFDHDEMYARRDELLDGRAVMAYLSFPSLKDPHAERYTAEIIAPLSYRSFEAYREGPWRRRGLDYESAKNRIIQGLLDLVERHHPGFRDLVEYSELGTPLTFEHFTAAPSGTIYGYPGTPDKYRKPWLGPETPIRDLYLAGSDAALLGIMGALMGGVLTASRLLGPLGFFKIMRTANSHSSAMP
ncbi:MAG: NAD(P)/FAD-dependent oxidoreductase [Planctomycetaceae bacterium]|nr:NAD(P)/FAD-dependent oxidoreductase [Planctomycetaceae bacterium]